MVSLNLKFRRPYRWTFIIADVSQAILGADFLKHHNLLVDLRGKKLIDRTTNLQTLGKIISCSQGSISTVDNNHPFVDILSEFPQITNPVSFINIESVSSSDVYHHIETTGFEKGNQISNKHQKLKVAAFDKNS